MAKQTFSKLPTLKPGDQVELIAPASRPLSAKLLNDLHDLLLSWQLNVTVSDDIFGDDVLCANTDEKRLISLQSALNNPDNQAVICVRGGYGSMRLLPALAAMTPPSTPKLFVGLSDITALHLYLQQQWHWPTLHGALALDKFSPESIAALKAILFGEVKQTVLNAKPLNALAQKSQLIESQVTGGNLCLLQASIGTTWQIDGRKKIILLEEINERGYRVDRMLEHLTQANIFKEAAAVVLGDFLEGKEPDGSSLIKSVLERFAHTCPVPVVQVEGVGHGYENFALPLGTSARLQLGADSQLVCDL